MTLFENTWRMKNSMVSKEAEKVLWPCATANANHFIVVKVTRSVLGSFQ